MTGTEQRTGVESEAEEGMLLAEYAVRMRLKNRIIVDIVGDGGVVDPEAWADEVRLALGSLRVEAEASARRMEQERGLASIANGRAEHEHDYRRLDTDNLDRRRRVYRLVARRLLSWENDAARVAALLEAARLDAKAEMDAALRRTSAGDPAGRVEDPALLKQRLRLVTSVDLPALERAVHGEQAPAAPPATGRLRRVLARFRRR